MSYAEADLDPSRDPETARRLAVRLGFAGLVPFVMLALWLASIPLDHTWRTATILLLTGYAAVILSFLSGIRFGLAIIQDNAAQAGTVAMSMLPPLLGWSTLIMPPPYSFALLAVAFAAHGAWDALAGQAGVMPEWFVKLRIQLTAVVVLTLVIAIAATA